MQRINPSYGNVAGWLSRHVGPLPGVRAIILFGSTARGDRRPRSDIDIAIHFDGTPQQWADVLDIVERMPTLLPLDIVRLDFCDKELRDEIANEGVTAVERRAA